MAAVAVYLADISCLVKRLFVHRFQGLNHTRQVHQFAGQRDAINPDYAMAAISYRWRGQQHMKHLILLTTMNTLSSSCSYLAAIAVKHHWKNQVMYTGRTKWSINVFKSHIKTSVAVIVSRNTLMIRTQSYGAIQWWVGLSCSYCWTGRFVSPSRHTPASVKDKSRSSKPNVQMSTQAPQQCPKVSHRGKPQDELALQLVGSVLLTLRADLANYDQ